MVINQQSSLYPLKQKAPRSGRENYMKKLKERLLKDNQEVQMTLKECIDYFQQGLNDPASTLIAIEETMRIMKEEHIAEINISVGETDYVENV